MSADGVSDAEWRKFNERAWRIRVALEVVRIVLLVVIGLTPLGARFVRLLSPSDSTWPDVLSWLIIVVVVASTLLPSRWWGRRARTLRPGLRRPQEDLARRVLRGCIMAGVWLAFGLVLVGEVFDLRGQVIESWGLIAAAFVVMLAVSLLRRSLTLKMRRSDRLTAVLASLPGMSASYIAVVEGWMRPMANLWAVSAGNGERVVVAPPIAAELTDRQLRALIAHEVAHLRHGDSRKRKVRTTLMPVCAAGAAFCLYYVPALRDLAGLPDYLNAQAGPFILGAGYLIMRILNVAHLGFVRAEERAADRAMVELDSDPDTCAEALGALMSMLGTPDRWTWAQRLLFATHPARRERLRALRDDRVGVAREE